MDVLMTGDSSARLSQWFGIVSIGLWLIISFDQLKLNYTNQSGDGLSVYFLLLWLAGDTTNFLGAYWGGLTTTMLVLAFYHGVCDLILMGQVFYYRRKRALHPDLFISSSSTLSSSAHVLPSLPSEYDRLLSAPSGASTPSSTSNRGKGNRKLSTYIAMGAGAVAFMIGAWILSGEQDHSGPSTEIWEFSSQIMGWTSGFLYLGSRIPQILKNITTRCTGLSMTMFGIAVLGNLTYVISILLSGATYEHLVINASWILGSGGVIGIDFIVLGQFYHYSTLKKQEKMLVEEEIGQEQ